MTIKNANFMVSSLIEEPLQPSFFIGGDPEQPPRPEDEPNKKRPNDVPPFPKPPLPPG